jgi:hypothetical protein
MEFLKKVAVTKMKLCHPYHWHQDVSSHVEEGLDILAEDDPNRECWSEGQRIVMQSRRCYYETTSTCQQAEKDLKDALKAVGEGRIYGPQ